MEFDYYSIINEERLHLEGIAKKPRDQLHKDMRKTLSAYFRHAPLLNLIVGHDLFLTEYAFLERAKKDKLLSECLLEIFDIYNSAKSKDKAKFFKLLAGYTEEVASAADNCAQMDMITPLEIPQFTKPTIKLVFREIGDFLEGSFQVFSKFLLSCLYIAEGKDVENITFMSFGQCVGEILNKGVLKDAYQPPPWNVPLSQWRNISAHNSYKSDFDSEVITCEYGSKDKKVVSLNLKDLYLLKYMMGQFYNVHKISHAVAFIGNQDKLKKYKPKLIVNPETLLHQIKEFTCSFGFFPKQPDSKTPVTRMMFDEEGESEINYPVTDMKPESDAIPRAQMLARRISVLMSGSKVSVQVFDRNGVHICYGVYGSNKSNQSDSVNAADV